jgi:hypothetical protein
MRKAKKFLMGQIKKARTVNKNPTFKNPIRKFLLGRW